ncbi:fatty acid cis/trans isomerase, partial [Aphanothece microscopica]|uniref:fatty acid cis/trans isomerase n=1 Tax=Aphanothece microscopica TaxID=1049561 RepID=UPI0039855F92
MKLSALFLALCMLSAGSAVAEEAVSFVDSVKPIFDSKCVACHACTDAPSQLDLRSRMGVERGAKKGNPYSPRLTFEPNTLLNQSPKTVEQWREAGFFSVTEGGQQSLMGKMLSLGHANPFAGNSVLPKDFDGRLDSLERENYTPNEAEFSAYAEQFPLEGMPFG